MAETKEPTKGIEVIDQDGLSVKPVFLAGYKNQIATATAIALHCLKQHLVSTTLVFGPPGTGKTLLPGYIAQKATEYFANIKFIRVLVPVLVTERKEIPEILTIILSEISDQEKTEALVLSVEELEAFTRHRGWSAFTRSLVSSIIDNSQKSALEKEMGLTIFLSAHFPSHVDEAIMGRVNYTIYFPPPSRVEIKEILTHFNIPEPDRVAEALTIKLEGEPISGRGLVNACENIERLKMEYSENIWDNADLLMANAVLVQRADSIKEYEAKNEYYIKKSQQTADLARRAPFSGL